MTHDPMCPLTPPTADYEPYLAEAVRAIQQETPCQCDLIAAAHERGYKEAEAFYTNSCFSCGYAGEWSTWICENCAKEQS
jgi:hypothetical protein